MPNPAPGFRNVPRSRIATRPAGKRVRVVVGGEVIADSRDALELKEGSYPAAYYFPRKDVRMERLERSTHSTHCPYKGDAAYYSIAGGPANAVWSYEHPYDEMLAIRELLAFYPNKVDAIVVADD
jgi:uncharacterized protein (DUF427 family)